MNKKNDTRFSITEISIKESFINLMKTKKFNNISVTDIAKQSNISRGTFYLHYNDKYELLENIENTILSEIKAIINLNYQKNSSKISMINIIEIFKHIKKNSEILKAIMIYNTNLSFEYKFKKCMNKNFNKNNDFKILNQRNNQIPQNYLSAYISAAHFSVIKEWLKNGMLESENEIAIILYKMTSFGPINAFFSQKNI